MVSREVLDRAFAEGGSVLIHGLNNGLPITNPADLPSDLELAQDDPDRQRAILAQMEADHAAKDAEIAALRQQLEGGSGASGEALRHTQEGSANSTVDTSKSDGGEADLRARLEGLTIAQILAEAETAKIEVPASIERKADIIEFVVNAAKE